MAQSSKGQSIYLQAGSSEELVAQLQAMSELPTSVSSAEFMSRFASRFAQLSPSKFIRTDSADHFITDLVGYGWIKLVGRTKISL